MRLPSNKWIIGIDEAGRGPLAGPVVVAGVKISVKRKVQSEKLLNGIKDSKKLTPKQREEWFRVLTAHPYVEWAAVKISPKVIDRINIARAANLGAYRIYQRLTRPKLTLRGHPERSEGSPDSGRDPSASPQDDAPRQLSFGRVLLDGSLYLPRSVPHETIIKGDEKIPAIAAASIIAKVTRDRIMRRLHKKFPQYGFNLHKGYGTKRHRERLAEFGYSSVHRLSYGRKILS